MKILNCMAVVLALLTPEFAMAKGHHNGKHAAAAAAAANTTKTTTAPVAVSKANYSQTTRVDNNLTTINATHTNKNGKTVYQTGAIVQNADGSVTRDILTQKPNGNTVRRQETLVQNANGTYSVSGTATKNWGNVHQYSSVTPINKSNFAIGNPAGSLNPAATAASANSGGNTTIVDNSAVVVPGQSDPVQINALNTNSVASGASNNRGRGYNVQTVTTYKAPAGNNVYNTGSAAGYSSQAVYAQPVYSEALGDSNSVQSSVYNTGN